MKQNWAICLLLLIGTVAGKESHAGDDIPIVQESHQHTFKSKPIEMANRKGIQYDVCNSSSAASGIKWIQAGFGIGAPDELQPAHCARFTTFSGEYHKQSVSEVVFQDEVRAHVENWRYCDVLSTLPIAVATTQLMMSTDSSRHSACSAQDLTRTTYQLAWWKSDSSPIPANNMALTQHSFQKAEVH